MATKKAAPAKKAGKKNLSGGSGETLPLSDLKGGGGSKTAKKKKK